MSKRHTVDNKDDDRDEFVNSKLSVLVSISVVVFDKLAIIGKLVLIILVEV